MIDIREDGWYLGVWFLAGEGIDWLCIVAREGDELVGRYRFRYYAEGDSRDPFDGRDRKSWYTMRCPAAEEKKMVDAIDAVSILAHAQGMKKTRFRELVRGDGRALFEVLKRAPFAHVKIEHADGAL